MWLLREPPTAMPGRALRRAGRWKRGSWSGQRPQPAPRWLLPMHQGLLWLYPTAQPHGQRGLRISPTGAAVVEEGSVVISGMHTQHRPARPCRMGSQTRRWGLKQRVRVCRGLEGAEAGQPAAAAMGMVGDSLALPKRLVVAGAGVDAAPKSDVVAGVAAPKAVAPNAGAEAAAGVAPNPNDGADAGAAPNNGVAPGCPNIRLVRRSAQCLPSWRLSRRCSRAAAATI